MYHRHLSTVPSWWGPAVEDCQDLNREAAWTETVTVCQVELRVASNHTKRPAFAHSLIEAAAFEKLVWAKERHHTPSRQSPSLNPYRAPAAPHPPIPPQDAPTVLPLTTVASAPLLSSVPGCLLGPPVINQEYFRPIF